MVNIFNIFRGVRIRKFSNS